MDTGRGTSHTGWGLFGGGMQGRASRGWGGWGGITLGEIYNVGDEGMGAANHHVMCVPM